MGTYVYYSLGDEYGVRMRFLADLDSFMEWFGPLVAEYPNDYPLGLLNKALDIRRRGIAAFRTEINDEADLIDRVVDEYWQFCDERGLHRELDITPSAHKWNRYASDLSVVLPTASATAKSYYKALFRGRSLVECAGHEYESVDGVFHFSWLLPGEVSEFLSELESFESRLNCDEDQAAGVFWVLNALKEANRRGASLVVAIA